MPDDLFADPTTAALDDPMEDDEIEADLAANGYEVRDVRVAPDRPGNEFVFVARRSEGSGR